MKKTRSKNKGVVRVVENIKKTEVKMLKEKEWQIEGDLILKEGKVHVLKDKVLRVEIIWLYHDMLIAKHKEKQKMTELVMRNYWWPRVAREVGKYVEGCNMC